MNSPTSSRRSQGLAVTLLMAAPLLAVPSTAFAYLDPATGSMILQGAVAGFFAAMFTIKLYWGKLVGIFKRTPAEEPDDAAKADAE